MSLYSKNPSLQVATQLLMAPGRSYPILEKRLMRRLLLVFLCGAIACNALFGVDFDGKLRESTSSDDAGNEVLDGDIVFDARNDGPPATFDASPRDAANDGNYLSEKDRLDALRVRIGDAPSNLNDLRASPAWLYWNDAAGVGHRLRPSIGTVEGPLPRVDDANDDTLLTRDVQNNLVTFTNAATRVKIGTFPEDTHLTFMIRSGAVFFQNETTVMRISTWKPSAPTVRTKGGTLATIVIDDVGRFDDTVIFRNLRDTANLLRVSVNPELVQKIAFAPLANSATNLPEGVVISHVVGADRRMMLYESGGTRDLVSEINALVSTTPVSERALFDFPVAFGRWLVFTARGGIFAFRPSDKKLLPLQLRAPLDPFSFANIRTLPLDGSIGFSVSTTAIAGTYTLRISSLLPP
jgi:hypothetical protein